MPKARTSMRKIREVLRLSQELGLSQRQVARSVRLGQSTVREQLDVRFTETTVEVLRRGVRVASHGRSRERGTHTTVREHMPKAHQAYLDWTPTRLVGWVQSTGPATATLVEQILQTRPHPQQGFRSCLGVMRLATRSGAARLEAACQRTLDLQSYSYKSVQSILTHGLDQHPLPEPEAAAAVVAHDNIRGARYYRTPDPEAGASC